jgi:mono/diheme cytochrome c family protein
MTSVRGVHKPPRRHGETVHVLLAAGALICTVAVGAQEGPQRDSLEALQADGTSLYSRDCASCHGAEGTSDGAGPALDGNNDLANKTRVIRQILDGSPDAGMDAFGQTLDDHDVAAVATFIRTAWNNAYGVVLPSEIAPVRQELKSQKTK